MKKLLIILIIVLSNIIIIAENCPIIFVHGQKSPGETNCGWDTWNHEESAFTDIKTSQYKEYSAYHEDCYQHTDLDNSVPLKTIFNFSYYPWDQYTEHGVISI